MSGKPPLFDHWLGPWVIGVLDETSVVWMRPYQEESHCGTPGCCEMRSYTLGPILDEKP